jgi:hypothetical protein
MENIKTFKEWLKIKEGLWLNDANAETSGTAVDAKRKSKPAVGGSMGSPMGGSGGGQFGQFGNMALGGR